MSNLRWKDELTPLFAVKPSGAGNDPEWNETEEGWEFNSNQDNKLALAWQVNHDHVQGGELRFHVHWYPLTTGTGNVAFRLDYKYAIFGAAFQSSWITGAVVTGAAGGVLREHSITALLDLTIPNETSSALIKGRMWRLGSNAGDTYGGDIIMESLDFHYQPDGFGSYGEYDKNNLP